MDTNRNAPHIPLGTEVEFYDYSAEYADIGERLLVQLSQEMHLDKEQIVKEELRDYLTSLFAFGIGPTYRIHAMDAVGKHIAKSHQIQNKTMPAIGFANFLPEQHPLRKIFNRINNELQRLFSAPLPQEHP